MPKYILSSTNVHKKTDEQTAREKKQQFSRKKICKFKTSYYLCNTKFQRWIHLRVRIRASHARHGGSNPLSTTENNCNRSLFILHSTAPVQRPGIPIRTGCATEQCKDRLSRRKAAAPDIEEAHLAVLRPQLLPKSRRN